ncbi:MAG: DUF402 domain-containing protein [Clostridiales bacterium]|nr:DUF402 domain-containing protein [Clostridiales bacterium]
MLKKKYIDLSHIDRIEETDYKHIYVDDGFKGHISLVSIRKMKQQLNVCYCDREITLLDEGYKCVVFLPDNENFCASAFYNTKDNIVGWYFDMIKDSSVDEKGVPYFYDLYLDIGVFPDFTTTVLDEDELQQALDDNKISTSEYELAQYTCKKVIDEYIPNKRFMVDFFEKAFLLPYISFYSRLQKTIA